MMDQREIEQLAVKLGMLAAGLNDLGDRLTEQSNQATQQVTRSAQSLANVAEISARDATARLEANASTVIAAGTRVATNDMERTLFDASNRLTTAISTLESRMTSLGRLHATATWKAFITTSMAALIAVASACFLTSHALDRVQETAWLDEVQRARASGSLQPCPEGGVCAYVNKRWHRIAR